MHAARLSRRSFLAAGGVLIVGLGLDIPLQRIAMSEGDTALTPNQGASAGSYGIARGGMQIRKAAATARQALLAQAAQRLGRPVGDLEVADGVVRAKDRTRRVAFLASA